MRIVIVGMGNQGKKRFAAAKDDVLATLDPAYDPMRFIDPLVPHFFLLEHISLDGYDAAFVCTPDSEKQTIVKFLLENGKHVLVEKPFFPTPEIVQLAREKNLVCYTAYNHRFEPHVQRMKEIIEQGAVGKLYLCRMFYGFGTAADVKGTWRDNGSGVLSEVGSHLFDLALFWFGNRALDRLSAVNGNSFEISALDHVNLTFPGVPELRLEASWISWKNMFTIDLYGSGGSAHIDGLLKWGPSSFTHRKRVLPSGRPTEHVETFVGPDHSWKAEYAHFKYLCETPGQESLFKDVKIAKILEQAYSDRTPRKVEALKEI